MGPVPKQQPSLRVFLQSMPHHKFSSLLGAIQQLLAPVRVFLYFLFPGQPIAMIAMIVVLDVLVNEWHALEASRQASEQVLRAALICVTLMFL